MPESRDQFFLKQTLRLAKKGMGWVNPNPMVGAVIVKDQKVISSGFHKRVGLPHAEIEALRFCQTSPMGATLYINLEPCTHFGRTPPCVEAIIQAGIKRVVCASLDPNPQIYGQGIVKLKKAGLDASAGILEKEARFLNEAFFTFHEKKRPFVAIKFATSLDGKLATNTGDSKWISNEKAKTYARRLRSQYQSILVGINTVLHDDPHLGVRIKTKLDPLRIILDSKLQIPMDAKVLRDLNVIIATTKRANQSKLAKLKKSKFKVIVFETAEIAIPKLLDELRQREIISMLVEGGGQVLGSFADGKLIDKVYAFHSPIIIGGEKAVSAVGGKGVKFIKDAIRLKNISFKKFDDNWLTIGSVST